MLEKQYGVPKHKRMDPLDELILTILSQNTNDVNRDRAFDRLRERFPTWEAVRDAPLEELVDAVRPAGLAPTKAPRIQEALRLAKTKSRRIQKILRSIAKRGSLNLNYLRRLPTEQVERELESFEGVGPKTVRCVLLFSLGREAFPIDTHIFRVLGRLGVIPSGMTVAKAHEYVPQFVPEGRSHVLHLNIITHGRTVCRARNPACTTCVVKRHCDYYAAGITRS